MPFAKKISSNIFLEHASKSNPFIANESFIHGYNVQELYQNLNFVEVLFLLFRGELPNTDDKQLFNQLLIALINPGPRHPATRAAMTAAISKTDPANVLPIGLLAISGQHLGASEVGQAAKFLSLNKHQAATKIASQLLEQSKKKTLKQTADSHLAPGFGNRFNSIDILPNTLGYQLAKLPGAKKHLIWGCQLLDALQQPSIGWLTTGVAAAALLDLGFHPRETIGLYQLISAPGLLAQAHEQSFKQITDMPFIQDDHYDFKK
jgi:citrate synthase